MFAESNTLWSRDEISIELTRMGLQEGSLVLLHAGLSKLGWVRGAEKGLLAGVRDAIGPSGTLVMPSFSCQLTDPATWQHPPVPENWHAAIRDDMELFDKDTPTSGIGLVAEVFRKSSGALRSAHPNFSFAAVGPLAARIVADHPLARALGPDSPLGRLNDLSAIVVLLGCGFESCTSFHLAEYLVDKPVVERVAHPARRENDRTEWSYAEDVRRFQHAYDEIGAHFESGGYTITSGFSGCARMFPMAEAVRAALEWFSSGHYDRLARRTESHSA